jgi:hypothetical protein
LSPRALREGLVGIDEERVDRSEWEVYRVGLNTPLAPLSPRVEAFGLEGEAGLRIDQLSQSAADDARVASWRVEGSLKGFLVRVMQF